MKKGKAPSLSWYPDKALTDTRRLSWHANGIYRTLLDTIWVQFQNEDCSIPDDDQFIAGEIGATLEDWMRARPEIMNPHRPLLIQENGRLYNNGLMKSKIKRDAFRKKQRENGRRGGRPKLPENEENKPKPFFDESQNEAKKSLPIPISIPTPGNNKEDIYLKSQKLSAEDLIAEGVDRKHAVDWLEVRRVKKAPLTQTAWDALKEQAKEAKLSTAEAVKMCAEKGWQGFRAAWLKTENKTFGGVQIPEAKPEDSQCGIPGCTKMWTRRLGRAARCHEHSEEGFVSDPAVDMVSQIAKNFGKGG